MIPGPRQELRVGCCALTGPLPLMVSGGGGIILPAGPRLRLCLCLAGSPLQHGLLTGWLAGIVNLSIVLAENVRGANSALKLKGDRQGSIHNQPASAVG